MQRLPGLCLVPSGLRLPESSSAILRAALHDAAGSFGIVHAAINRETGER